MRYGVCPECGYLWVIQDETAHHPCPCCGSVVYRMIYEENTNRLTVTYETALKEMQEILP